MRRFLPPSRFTLVLAVFCALSDPARAAGDAVAGKAVFAAKCASCHSVGPSARAGFGPHLNAVVGRQAGSTSDYRYSPAMKRAGIVWNEQNLSAFIEAPGKLVPDNKMRFWGIGDKKQREDLVAYLRTFP
jgi:cytochrome c